MTAHRRASGGRQHRRVDRWSKPGCRRRRRGAALLLVALAILAATEAGSAMPTAAGAAAETPTAVRAPTNLTFQPGGSWTVRQLSQPGSIGANPSISGDHVVWQEVDPLSYSRSIVSHLLSTGITAPLTGPAHHPDARSPDVGGSEVVWIEYKPGWPEFTVWRYSFESQAAMPLYTESTEWYAAFPRVDDGAAVWIAITNVGATSTYTVLHSNSIGPIAPVSPDSNVVGLDIDGPWITWRILDGPDAGVYLWDSRTPVGASRMTGANRFAEVIGGGRFIYESGGDLVLRDLESGADTPLLPADDFIPLAVSDWWLVLKEIGVAPEDARVFALDLHTVGGDEPPLMEELPIPTLHTGWYGTDGDNVVFVGSPDDPYMNDAAVYLATRAAVPPTPSFVDVPTDHPYRPAIESLAQRGIVVGYPVSGGAEFRPGNPVWRAQFAKMICELWNLEVDEADVSPFTDLGPDDPATPYPHEYVAAAARAGITTGITPTTFGPYTDISRAQVITMIVRSAQRLDPSLLAAPPADYPSLVPAFSEVHDANLRIAQYNGLLKQLQGYGSTWDPWAKATRGEVAQMLYNLKPPR